MSPDRLRAYVLIITRDLVPCLVGAYLAIHLTATHQLEVWHGGLIATCFGIPLAAPRGPKEAE